MFYNVNYCWLEFGYMWENLIIARSKNLILCGGAYSAPHAPPKQAELASI